MPLRVIFLCKDSKLIQHTFNHIIGYHILTIIYDDHQKDNEINTKHFQMKQSGNPQIQFITSTTNKQGVQNLVLMRLLIIAIHKDAR